MKYVVTGGVSRIVRDDEKIQEYPELRVVILTTDSEGKYTARAYSGKRTKTDFNYYYRTEQSRYEAVAKYLADIKRRIDKKKEKQASKKAFKTSLQVGDILSGTWGYGQTQVEYYQVVKVNGAKRIEIVECGQIVVDGSRGDMCEEVLAGSPMRDAKPIKKMVQEGDYISFQCFSLHKWNGQAIYQSHYH